MRYKTIWSSTTSLTIENNAEEAIISRPFLFRYWHVHATVRPELFYSPVEDMSKNDGRTKSIATNHSWKSAGLLENDANISNRYSMTRTTSLPFENIPQAIASWPARNRQITVLQLAEKKHNELWVLPRQRTGEEADGSGHTWVVIVGAVAHRILFRSAANNAQTHPSKFPKDHEVEITYTTMNHW